MEQQNLQYIRAWQGMGQGSLAFPGSRLGITRHAINVEQAAYGLLAHKVFGAAATELTASAAATQEEGVWEYPYVDFIVHRSGQKFAPFLGRTNFRLEEGMRITPILRFRYRTA
jgi:hypothetical protein